MTDSVCDGATGTCSCPAAMYLDGMTCRNRKLKILSVYCYGSLWKANSKSQKLSSFEKMSKV